MKNANPNLGPHFWTSLGLALFGIALVVTAGCCGWLR